MASCNNRYMLTRRPKHSLVTFTKKISQKTSQTQALILV